MSTRSIVVVVSLAAGLAVLYRFGPSPEQVVHAVEWMQALGPAGWLVFAVTFLVWTLLALPASWPQMIAGFLFGPVLGFLVASAASTLCSTAAFMLTRTRLRSVIASRLGGDVRFHSIDRAIGEGGVQLVAILRLSPLSPYNVVTYALGLTRVPLSHYVLGTALGSIPPLLLYTYLGSTVSDLSRLLDGSAAAESGWVTSVALVTTLVATALVTRFAQLALRRSLARVEGSAR